MTINFQVTSIQLREVQSFFTMEAANLKQLNITKMIVDEKPGYPCRLSLEDAEIGEEVLLLPYEHHQVNSPYQASGPVFIRKNAQEAQLNPNEIPTMLLHRLLSLRAYDKNATMIDARTIKGEKLAAMTQDIFSNNAVKYIQVHNAGPGCYNCQINRVN